MTNMATPTNTEQANGSFTISEATTTRQDNASSVKQEILKRMANSLSKLIGIIDMQGIIK